MGTLAGRPQTQGEWLDGRAQQSAATQGTHQVVVRFREVTVEQAYHIRKRNHDMCHLILKLASHITAHTIVMCVSRMTRYWCVQVEQVHTRLGYCKL